MVRYEVVPRSEQDDEALFALYEEVFGQSRTEASRRRWRWQYLENPESPGDPRIWVVREGARPQGQMGTMPVRLWWGAAEVSASWGMDYYVRREVEGRGLGVRLANAWSDDVDVALAMGLTPPAYAVYKRLGFRDVGRIPFLQMILDPGAVARRRLGPLVGRLVGPALGLALALRGLGARRAPRGIAVKPVSEIGPEYDALWERARVSYVMCVRRDAAYLRWKYQGCPHKQYDLVSAWNENELVGFAVSRVEDYRGLRLGWIVDVFAHAGDTAAKDALITTVLQSFRASGVARAQAFCLNGALAGDLRRHGFFGGTSTALFCVKPTGEAPEVFRDPGRWHVVFGDGDMDR